jgi:hypothetical protein
VAKFFLRLEVENPDLVEVNCSSLEELRGSAIRYLGAYLSEHPNFAAEGHWRLVVENQHRQSCMHVIVAAVDDRACSEIKFEDADETSSFAR